MTEEIKDFRIRFSDSDNVYVVVCQAYGSLEQLLDKLRSCPGCEVTEVPRDKIQDDKAMGEIYVEKIRGEG